ncbi:hypothetical protein LCM19_05905 [Qipengyuania flava]|nr:hypothetical protein [Qipengyuania flava]
MVTGLFGMNGNPACVGAARPAAGGCRAALSHQIFHPLVFEAKAFFNLIAVAATHAKRRIK